MTKQTISPHALAAALAARLLHDIAGPASGVISGMELYADPEADQREAALNLVSGSGKALMSSLRFSAAAYTADNTPLGSEALHALALTLFAHSRLRLEWRLGDTGLTALASQALLILTQLAVGGLPRGGVVIVTATRSHTGECITVEGEGPGAGIGPEARRGMAGEPVSDGLRGRWAPGYYLYSIAALAGGGVTCSDRSAGFRLTARF